ncbi:MAG: FkbM family methyltransferase [Nevskiaceae bacterium]
MLQRLLKPWFVFRPTQLIRRLVSQMRPASPGYAPMRTSWGAEILADPAKTIGRSISTTGLYDLAVSEALARLITPGDTVVDAGANVGYMTVLAGMVTGPTGRVLAFEPHPELFGVLERNVAAARAMFGGTFHTTHAALGDRTGTAELQVPAAFESNDGLCRIRASPAGDGHVMNVRMSTLDEVLTDTRPVVLKLDVEGFEPQVLKGAARSLARRQIRHVVFEEHATSGGETARLLEGAGYRIFALGWSLLGPKVGAVGAGRYAKEYESPSFIASLAPDEVLARCARRGWRVLETLTVDTLAPSVPGNP